MKNITYIQLTHSLCLLAFIAVPLFYLHAFIIDFLLDIVQRFLLLIDLDVLPWPRFPNFSLAIVKAHGNVYIVNDINEIQIVTANKKAGFHSQLVWGNNQLFSPINGRNVTGKERGDPRDLSLEWRLSDVTHKGISINKKHVLCTWGLLSPDELSSLVFQYLSHGLPGAPRRSPRGTLGMLTKNVARTSTKMPHSTNPSKIAQNGA